MKKRKVEVSEKIQERKKGVFTRQIYLLPFLHAILCSIIIIIIIIKFNRKLCRVWVYKFIRIALSNSVHLSRFLKMKNYA